MAPMERKNLSMEALHTFYSEERELFARMIFSLQIDGDLAMKIISYWLWLQHNTNKEIIHGIEPLSDESLRRIFSLGKKVLENASRSKSSVSKKTLSGVNYFLRNVCYEVFDDLKERADYEKDKKALLELDLEEFLSRPDLYTAGRPSLSHGDSSGNPSSGLDNAPNSCIPVQSPLRTTVTILRSPISMQRVPFVRPPLRLHPDERKLFVTFSNGWPLTFDEILEFFMTRYNNDVESIHMEEPRVPRAPQYAHVTFFNAYTVEVVLGGHTMMKYIINGKHLWVRRFIPKRRRGRGPHSN